MKSTIYDVARLAGVSLSTVSRVLNRPDSVRPETRERVMQAIARLNYQPSMVASALTKKQTFTVGLLVPDISNPFFSELARAVEDAGKRHQFNLVVCNTDYDLDKEAEYITVLQRKGVDGLLFASAEMRDENLFRLSQSGYPVVLVARQVEGLDVDSVRVDDYTGGLLATRHLLELGHTAIAMIGGTPRDLSAFERIKGYTAALQAAGIPWRNEWLQIGDFTIDSGVQLTHRLLNLPGPPTAVFAANDMMAAGAMKAIRAHGLRVPADVSVVGFDGTDLALLVDPELTTVVQPIVEMARLAMDLLVRQINAGRVSPEPATHTLLPPGLVVRGTTAPPPT